MKLEIKFKHVLVKKSEVISKSKGGIIVPDVALDKALSGTVLASASSEFKVGDKVIFGKYSGIEMKGITEGFDDFFLFREEELFGIIDSPNGTELIIDPPKE